MGTFEMNKYITLNERLKELEDIPDYSEDKSDILYYGTDFQDYFNFINEMGLKSESNISNKNLNIILNQLELRDRRKFPIILKENNDQIVIKNYKDLIIFMQFEWSLEDKKEKDIILANTAYDGTVLKGKNNVFGYNFYYSYNKNIDEELSDEYYLKFKIFRFLLKEGILKKYGEELYENFLSKIITHLKNQMKNNSNSKVVSFVHLKKPDSMIGSLTYDISLKIKKSFPSIPIIDINAMKNTWGSVILNTDQLEKFMMDIGASEEQIMSIIDDFNRIKSANVLSKEFEMKKINDGNFREIRIGNRIIRASDIRRFIKNFLYINETSNIVLDIINKAKNMYEKLIFYIIDDIGTSGTTLQIVKEKLIKHFGINDLTLQDGKTNIQVDIIKLAIVDMGVNEK